MARRDFGGNDHWPMRSLKKPYTRTSHEKDPQEADSKLAIVFKVPSLHS